MYANFMEALRIVSHPAEYMSRYHTHVQSSIAIHHSLNTNTATDTALACI